MGYLNSFSKKQIRAFGGRSRKRHENSPESMYKEANGSGRGGRGIHLHEIYARQ